MLAGAVCCAAVCRAGGTGSAGSPDGARATTHTDHFANVPRTGTLCLQIVDSIGVSPPMALSIEGRTES